MLFSWIRRETADAPPGRARVLSVFDLLIAWFAQPGYHGCVVLNTATDTRGDPAAIGELARAHLARYRDLLTERVDELDPAPANAASLAWQLLLLIGGAIVVSVIDGPDTSSAGFDARIAAGALIDASTIAAPGD